MLDILSELDQFEKSIAFNRVLAARVRGDASMNINYISVSNYRGIHRLDRLAVGSLNTLVGKNDSGKSIILFALARFFDEKFDSREVYKGKPEVEDTFIELGFAPGEAVDDLALDSGGLIVIRKVFNPEGKRNKCTSYYQAHDFVDERYQDLWNKKEAELNALVKALGGDPKISGRGNTNLARIAALKELLPGAERRETLHELGSLLENLAKAYPSLELPRFSFFQADSDLDIDATTFQSQFRPLITRSLDQQAARTTELVAAIESDLTAEFEEIRRLMAKNVSGLVALKPEVQADWAKAFKFDLGMRFAGEPYDVPMSQRGTGFRRLLMVAYFEHLVAKHNLSNHIFAIEEPETYLHPAAQEDLLASIRGLSSGAQFFLTTHSPVFAGASDCAHSILVTKDAGGTSCYTRGEGVRDRIIAELGVKPDYNLLRNAQFLLFVEGPDDVQILHAAARALRGANLEADGILCLFGGGSALKNYAELDLFRKLAEGRGGAYAVLIDGDNSETSKAAWVAALRQRCAADGAVFHQLTRREIENYCCPERVKQVYVDAILRREGPSSQNPRIAEIRGLDLRFDATADVDALLRTFNFSGFKGTRCVAAFEHMDAADWERVDPDRELGAFFDLVYARLSPAPAAALVAVQDEALA